MDVKNKKVAVALSGGVDSSVCALLLKQQGYEVVGITGKMTPMPSSDIVVQNAQKVADKLDIEFKVLNVSQHFEEKVIRYFEEGYKRGETPNPCAICNKFI